MSDVVAMIKKDGHQVYQGSDYVDRITLSDKMHVDIKSVESVVEMFSDILFQFANHEIKQQRSFYPLFPLSKMHRRSGPRP